MPNNERRSLEYSNRIFKVPGRLSTDAEPRGTVMDITNNKQSNKPTN